jgi:hypothetical protein
MTEFVHLVGSEYVLRAGREMVVAAETMSRSANLISEALQQHERFMDDWLQRFERTLDDFHKMLTTPVLISKETERKHD